MTFEHARQADPNEQLRQQEREFVGEIMPQVVDFMVQRYGFDFNVLQATGRPVALECIVPSEIGERTYSLTIGTDDTDDMPARIGEKAPLLYRFRVTDQEEVLYPALDEMQRVGIITMLEEHEGADGELTSLLLDPSRVDELGDITCATESVVQYMCDADELTIEKEVGTNYYLDGERIMMIGVDGEDVRDDKPVDDDLEQMFASMGDDMAAINLDDLKAMREVLYYLQLPGGELLKGDEEWS